MPIVCGFAPIIILVIAPLVVFVIEWIEDKLKGGE